MGLGKKNSFPFTCALGCGVGSRYNGGAGVVLAYQIPRTTYSFFSLKPNFQTNFRQNAEVQFLDGRYGIGGVVVNPVLVGFKGCIGVRSWLFLCCNKV